MRRLLSILGVLVLGLALFTLWRHMGDMSAHPTFDMVEVEPGRRLHAVCEGPKEAQFVLYDAGAFGIYTDGWWVQQHLKDDFRVCLYDRAGLGWSDPVPQDVTPTPRWHVEDMRRLANALKVKAPYILVGHSMAGIRLHSFSSLYPDEIAGMVFVDAAAPDRIRGPQIRRLIRTFTRIMQLGAVSAQLGLARAVSPLVPDELTLPAAQRADKKRSIAWVSHHKASREELAALEQEVTESYLANSNADQRPMAVFSAGQIGRINAQMAEQAKNNTGYGIARNFPKESHVSLLNKENSKMLAQAVRDIAAQSRQTSQHKAAQ